MSDRIAPPRCSTCGLFLGKTYAVTGIHEQSYDKGEYLKEVRGECVMHGDMKATVSEWNDWDMWFWEEVAS